MLEIKYLTCGYNSIFQLKNINFKVDAGDFLGIIGPNGSGKTTLLKAITRAIKPQKGYIYFQGKDIQKIGFKELAKKIAVVSQNLTINSMTVYEFVLLGRIPHYEKFQFFETRKDLEVVEHCMSLTNTYKLKDKSLSHISSGERQLVSIARALSQQPKLILLDEPTTHLDITYQIGILDLIRKLNKKYGLTVIIILHDLNLASEYCDRLLLLKNGIIQKIGTPYEVLTYQIIEDVYNTTVIVKENPVSNKPYVFLVPEEIKRKG